MLALLAVVFTWQQEGRQQRIESQRAEVAREAEKQRSQDEALQTYLDQMGQLLLEENLRSAEEYSEVRKLARARTLTALERLEPTHKRAVLGFLTEATLVQGVDGPQELERPPQSYEIKTLIALVGADLSNTNLGGSFLPGANLSKADLSGASLEVSFGMEADLSGADLSGVRIFRTNMDAADMSHADLREADLREAFLTNVNLSYANLDDANLSYTDLEGANLKNIVFSNYANRPPTKTLEQQVMALEKHAESLEGATLPNGQKYEEWLEDREGRGEDEENSGS